MQSSHQGSTLNLKKLKRLIQGGVEAIPVDKKHKSAVLVLGDTGVGKTTILSYLARRKLVVRVVGLNTVLDAEDQSMLKISHDRFSQTSIPSKVIIDDHVFFDCAGFKDNRGQQFQISNSFFIQRLFDIYQNIKILLMVDQISITEARAEKFPKLIRNLLKAFQSLKSIQDGVILLINRAKPEYSHQDYCKQLLKLSEMKQQQFLFNPQEREFLRYLVNNNRVCLFKQAAKQNESKPFEHKQQNLLRLVKDANYVKSKHINNIISESAKLAIRDYMDRLLYTAEDKIEKLCHDIVKQIASDGKSIFASDLNNALKLKTQILDFINSIKNSQDNGIMNIFIGKVPEDKLLPFEQDFNAVLFFKAIYDKADTYFTSVRNKIVAQLSIVLTTLDNDILALQKKQQQALEAKKKVQAMEEKQLQLQAQLEEQRLKSNKKQANISELQTKVKEIQNFYETERAKNTNQSAEVNNLKALLEEQKLNSNKKQANLSELQTKIKEIEHYYETQKVKNTNQQAQVTILKAQLEQKDRLISQKYQNELAQLQKDLKNLRIQFDEKDEQLQLVSIENLSLKHELQLMSLQSKTEKAFSKTSKYPDVVCTHFKNGGKCINCIKAWKKNNKQSQEI